MVSWTLLHVAGLVALVAAALAARRFVKRPELEHLLWLLVLLKLVVPPFVEVPLLPASAPEPAAVATDADGLGELALGDAPLGAGALAFDDAASLGALDHAGEGGSAGLSWWFVAWALSSLAGLLLVAYRCARFQRFLRANGRKDAALEREVRSLAKRLDLARLPAVLVVDAPITPALWPLGRVRLLFPAELLDALSPVERESVLLHELAHFARRDHWVRLPETLALCVWWWLPPVWWFRRELRFSEEACCDGHVVRALDGNPRPYAEALIKTAELLTRTASRPLPRFATGAHALQPLSRRIQKIMEHRSPGTAPRLRRGALLAVGLALLPCLPSHAAPEPASERVERIEAQPVDPGFADATVGVANPLLGEPKARPVSQDQEPPLTREEALALKQALELVEEGEPLVALKVVNALRGADASAAFDFTAGNLLLQAERLEEAVAAYEIAVSRFPEYRRAWKNLGVAFVRAGEHSKAAVALRRTIDLGGGDGTTYGLLGLCSAKLGRTGEAESAYWMANLLDPEARDWKLGLLQVFVQGERHAEALALCERMLEATPADDQLRKLRASALTALGRHGDAADSLKPLREPATDPKGYVSLGDVYLKDGRHAEAVEAYAMALKLDPVGTPEALLGRGKLLIAKSDVAAAGRLLEWLALALGETSRHQASLEALAQAVERAAGQEEGRVRVTRTETRRLILLEVTSAGTVLGNGQEIGVDGVGPLIVKLEAASSGPVTVILHSSADADPALITRVIDAAKVAGEEPMVAGVDLSPPESVSRIAGIRAAVERHLANGELDAAIERVARNLKASPSLELRTLLEWLVAKRPAPPVGVDELDAKPRNVYQPSPKLTAELRELPGRTVQVLFIVGEDGRPRSVRVQTPDPKAAAQDEAAVEAVERWRFEPGTKDGKRVSFRMRVPITFPGQER